MNLTKSMSETKFTKWFCECLELYNTMTFAIVGSMMQEAGWPDRYFAHRNFGDCWIEFKKDDEPLRKLQDKIIRDLNAHSTKAFVGRFISDKLAFQLEDADGNVFREIRFGDMAKDKGKCGRTILDVLVVQVKL